MKHRLLRPKSHPVGPIVRIALLHYDVTIKPFIKILLFNARNHGRLEATKQRKFTENRSKNRINSGSGIISKYLEYY